LLNSTLANSLEAQRKNKIRLRIMVHGIQQLGKQRIDPEQVPYAERLKLIQQILPHLPPDVFHLPDQATDPASAQRLWADVREGRHPLTHEGVVIHPKLGRPSKAKLTEENDVHLTGVFPGEGKYHGNAAGGFEYALEPGGATTGRVGSGLSDELRRDLYTDPDAYVGRVARIRAQEQLPSGAYRAPSFLAFHEDYPSIEDVGISKHAADEEKVPTVAVDLDGTLAVQEKPFDAKHIGRARRSMKKWLEKFRKVGARIIIFTVRGDKDLVSGWLDEHDMPYDYINENPDQPAGSSGKVIADVYWDDRGVSAKRPAESGPQVLAILKTGEDVLAFIELFQEAA
jgi:hypothetical protein